MMMSIVKSHHGEIRNDLDRSLASAATLNILQHMKRQLLTIALGTGLIVVISLLWLRVGQLEKTVNVDPTKSQFGVPWDVERAMMGGAHENDNYLPHDQTIHIEAAPNSIEFDSRPKMNLENLNMEQLLQKSDSK